MLVMLVLVTYLWAIERIDTRSEGEEDANRERGEVRWTRNPKREGEGQTHAVKGSRVPTEKGGGRVDI